MLLFSALQTPSRCLFLSVPFADLANVRSALGSLKPCMPSTPWPSEFATSLKPPSAHVLGEGLAVPGREPRLFECVPAGFRTAEPAPGLRRVWAGQTRVVVVVPSVFLPPPWLRHTLFSPSAVISFLPPRLGSCKCRNGHVARGTLSQCLHTGPLGGLERNKAWPPLLVFRGCLRGEGGCRFQGLEDAVL